MFKCQITKLSAVALLAYFATAAVPADAHHSGAMYDRKNPVVFKGVVKVFNSVNPHTYLKVVADPGQSNIKEGTEWVIEMTSPGNLTRNGWSKNSVKAGDHVEVKIAPRHDGASEAGMVYVKMVATGEMIGAGGSGANRNEIEN